MPKLDIQIENVHLVCSKNVFLHFVTTCFVKDSWVTNTLSTIAVNSIVLYI